MFDQFRCRLTYLLALARRCRGRRPGDVVRVFTAAELAAASDWRRDSSADWRADALSRKNASAFLLNLNSSEKAKIVGKMHERVVPRIDCLSDHV
jgi:hypothetical protein